MFFVFGEIDTIISCSNTLKQIVIVSHHDKTNFTNYINTKKIRDTKINIISLSIYYNNLLLIFINLSILLFF